MKTGVNLYTVSKTTTYHTKSPKDFPKDFDRNYQTVINKFINKFECAFYYSGVIELNDKTLLSYLIIQAIDLNEAYYT